jgi:hypothetical protein
MPNKRMHIIDNTIYTTLRQDDMFDLAEYIGRRLYKTSIGRGLEIYLLGPQRLVIKGKLPGMKAAILRSAKSLTSLARPDHEKYADFDMEVEIKNNKASIYLAEKYEQWKEHPFCLVREAIESQ